MKRRAVGQLRSAVGAVIEALEERRVLSVSVEGGVLVVRGTAGDDVIILQGGATGCRVTDNGVVHDFLFQGISGIRIEGGDGHDELGMTSYGSNSIELPMTISGGAGDDTIAGGLGHDVLRGGSGEDDIAGRGPGFNSETGKYVEVAPRVVGPDWIRGDAASDDFQPESGDDDFHGAAVDLASVRAHRGVLYIRGTAGDDRLRVDLDSWNYNSHQYTRVSGSISGWNYLTYNRLTLSELMAANVAEVRIDGGGGRDEVWAMETGGFPVPKITLTSGGASRALGLGVWSIGSSGAAERTTKYGSATLSADGVLTLEGTDGADGLYVGAAYEAGMVTVGIDSSLGHWWATFALADVRLIRVNCGGGNDIFSYYNRWETALRMPVIVDGGAGNDLLRGQDNRDTSDHFIRGPYSGMAATLMGGEGDDEIEGGVNVDRMEGGAGNDLLYCYFTNGSLDGGPGYDRFITRDPVTGQMVEVSEFPVPDDGADEDDTARDHVAESDDASAALVDEDDGGAVVEASAVTMPPSVFWSSSRIEHLNGAGLIVASGPAGPSSILLDAADREVWA